MEGWNERWLWKIEVKILMKGTLAEVRQVVMEERSGFGIWGS